MADIADQHDQATPTDLEESQSVGNGNTVAESRGTKRPRPSAVDDDDDDDEKGGRERRKIEIKFISDKSRRHITFSKRKAGIMKKVCCSFSTLASCHRAVTLAHPLARPPASLGLHLPLSASGPRVCRFLLLCVALVLSANDCCFPLQAYELSVLTGTQVLLLVVSETGLVYTFTTPKLQPLVTKAEGKNLIQVSLQTYGLGKQACRRNKQRMSVHVSLCAPC